VTEHSRSEFDASYQDGTPPWDIGRPQPAFVRLADAGDLRGRVLDVGCGTGEHALLAAVRGLDATVLDCGLFHVFNDGDRARFVSSLSAIVKPGGRYFLLCFSDKQPGDWGPRRIRKEEVPDSFARGWRIDSIEDAVLELTWDSEGAKALLAAFTRI
jgi:SAM-dependent methyltransferase